MYLVRWLSLTRRALYQARRSISSRCHLIQPDSFFLCVFGSMDICILASFNPDALCIRLFVAGASVALRVFIPREALAREGVDCDVFVPPGNHWLISSRWFVFNHVCGLPVIRSGMVSSRHRFFCRAPTHLGWSVRRR